MERILSAFLMCVLLYQAGCYACDYLDNSLLSNLKKSRETFVVELAITLPYQIDLQAPEVFLSKIRFGDNFYQMKEQRFENYTLYTSPVID